MKTEVLKNFIVLEGLDGSGTTTQLNSLSKKLEQEGIKVLKTFEPTDNKIGKLIRKVLQKEYIMEPKTISRLFVADRNEHLYGTNGILDNLDQNRFVVCDRYLFSSLAYQSAQCGFNFVKDLNSSFPIPEHLIFIKVPVKVCQERITKRGEDKELFEAMEFQIKVNDFYLKAIDLYKNTEMKIHIIDGLKSPEEITNEIYSLIRQ